MSLLFNKNIPRSAVTFEVAPRPRIARDDAPFDLCFTPQAMAMLLATVGTRPPETGAKGFGPIELFGFDVIEFDASGSQRASGTVYSPDTEWGEQRCRFWLDQPEEEMRVWTGDLHSHPGSYGLPSGKSGRGLGDLGYVQEVFAANDAMQFFAVPILTQPSTRGPAMLWPWIISRDDPHRPLWANVRICPASEFPERIFNPVWEASLENVTPPGENMTSQTAADESFHRQGQPSEDITVYIPTAYVPAPGNAAGSSSGVSFPPVVTACGGVLLLGIAVLQCCVAQRSNGNADARHDLGSLSASGSKPFFLNAKHISPPLIPSLSLNAPDKSDKATEGQVQVSTSVIEMESIPMNAFDTIARLNPNALHDQENGRDVFIEDIDVEGRWYRVEYRCLPSGAGASAWLLYNPWGNNPFSYEQSHLRGDGLICIGAHFDPAASPFDLDYAVRRTRLWTVGYSYLREHGYAATCEALPDWKGG